MSTREAKRTLFLNISIQKLTEYLTYIYFLLTFFEPYLNGVLGSIGKYYIFILMMIIIYWNNYRITLHSYTIPYILWLIYRFITLLWTDNSYMANSHMLSQIGMVGLLVIFNARIFSRNTIQNIIKVMWASSFVISVLGIFFGRSYHGIVESRQVLVLFGQEIDPNNQAMLSLVGVSISFYYLIYERKYIICSIVALSVNIMAIFMTGSRGGFVSVLVITLFIIIFNKGCLSSNIKKLFILTGILLLAIFLLENYIPQETYHRLVDMDTYEGGSKRIDIWTNGIQLLSENVNIVFGAGWGDYYGYNGVFAAMHNTFLAMLCDVGLLGVLIFFVPIVSKIVWCIRNKEFMPVMLIIAAFVPCFFIEAINKRIFWNPILLLFASYASYKQEKSVKLYEAYSFNQ